MCKRVSVCVWVDVQMDRQMDGMSGQGREQDVVWDGMVWGGWLGWGWGDGGVKSGIGVKL